MSRRILAFSLVAITMLAVGWWVWWASPQARYYRTQNAALDTLNLLRAFEDSAKAAVLDVQRAQTTFMQARRRLPTTTADFARAGLDSSSLEALGGDIWYRSSRLPPESPGSSKIGLRVVIDPRNKTYFVMTSLEQQEASISLSYKCEFTQWPGIFCDPPRLRPTPR